MSASTEPSVASASRLLEADVAPEAAWAHLKASGVEVGIVARGGRILGFVHRDDLVPAPWREGDAAGVGERLAPAGRVLWIG